MLNVAKFITKNPEYAVRIYARDRETTTIELGRMVGKERLVCHLTVALEELTLRRAPIDLAAVLEDLKSQIIKEMITK